MLFRSLYGELSEEGFELDELEEGGEATPSGAGGDASGVGSSS